VPTGQFDFDGEPIETFREWCALFASPERLVAFDVLGDVEVSTVWLGIDYSFGRGVPLIYETMVFGGELHEVGERYPNRIAAQAGHDRWVAAVRECEAVRR
jgi:hypothetical protein